MGEILGYIVLTKQPDNSWKDDWDGEMHPSRESFIAELANARAALGEGNVKASVVREWAPTKATRRAVSVQKEVYIVAVDGHALQDGLTGYCYSHGSFSCVDNLTSEELEAAFRAAEDKE